MCGIFGFISRQDHGPDIARLRRIAQVTQSRGMHAFGLAWLNRNGQIQSLKYSGPAQDHLDELDRCRDAIIVIGHCRYATHGSPADSRNNHPHPAGRGWLVHNGVVHNHLALIHRYHLQPQTECDSEVLGLLMARCPGTINQRAVWTANQAAGDLAILGLWTNPARLLIVRRGRPLCFGQGRHGYYIASLPEGLPGRAQAVPDRVSYVLGYQDGELARTSNPIAQGPEWGEFNHCNILKLNELSA